MQHLQKSPSIDLQLCADLDQLLSADLSRSTYDKNEISMLKSLIEGLQLENKELKHQQKQMNVRLRKLEEVVNVAQIEIGFKADRVGSRQWIATCNSQV